MNLGIFLDFVFYWLNFLYISTKNGMIISRYMF